MFSGIVWNSDPMNVSKATTGPPVYRLRKRWENCRWSSACCRCSTLQPSRRRSSKTASTSTRRRSIRTSSTARRRCSAATSPTGSWSCSTGRWTIGSWRTPVGATRRTATCESCVSTERRMPALCAASPRTCRPASLSAVRRPSWIYSVSTVSYLLSTCYKQCYFSSQICFSSSFYSVHLHLLQFVFSSSSQFCFSSRFYSVLLHLFQFEFSSFEFSNLFKF